MGIHEEVGISTGIYMTKCENHHGDKCTNVNINTCTWDKVRKATQLYMMKCEYQVWITKCGHMTKWEYQHWNTRPRVNINMGTDMQVRIATQVYTTKWE